MQFLVSVNLNPEKSKEPPAPELAEAESEGVRGLYMAGLIRQIWVRADKSGGFMIVEEDSAEAVAAKFATLPLVREGILQRPEIVALAPYWGFAPRG
jgi:hypothetical protein